MTGKVSLIVRCLLGTAALASLLSGSGVSARTFESFNGKFHITYPDTWDQIDYRSVDFYLTQGNPNPDLLNYEGVFAPISDLKFFEGPYLLLTVDTIGELTGANRAASLASIAGGFGNKIDSSFIGDIFDHIKPDTPLFDPRSQMLAVETGIHEGRTLTKRNLLVVKLYERGLVNFYFYAPDSLWDKSVPVFAQIAHSFTPGAPKANPIKESVKIANIDKEEPAPSSFKKTWLIPPGAVVVLIIVIVALRRRKKESRQSGQN